MFAFAWFPGEVGRDRPERRMNVLNRYSGPSPMPCEAGVSYRDGDFRVVRPGAFVRCAVTNVPVPLEELKYWSVELQEAYSTPEAVLQGLYPGKLKLPSLRRAAPASIHPPHRSASSPVALAPAAPRSRHCDRPSSARGPFRS